MATDNARIGARMDNARRRAAAIECIMARVAKATGRILDEQTALRISICCALRNSEDVLAVVTNRMIATLAMQCHDSVRMSVEEFDLLLGYEVHFDERQSDINVLSSDSDLTWVCSSVEKALTFALQQDLPKANWKRVGCRLSSLVALEFEDHTTALRMALGPFGESDARRIDDVRDEIESMHDVNVYVTATALELLLTMVGIVK